MGELKVFATAECTEHRDALRRETWIVCAHTSDIVSARLRPIDNQQVRGEAVCPACRMHLDRARPDLAELRIACGSCVRDRWPIENAA